MPRFFWWIWTIFCQDFEQSFARILEYPRFIHCRELHLRTFCHQIHQCAKIGGGPSNQFWQCHDLGSSYSWSSSLMILVSYLITWSHLYVHKAWQRLHSSCLAIYFPICEYKAEMCGALRGFCLSEEAEIIAFLLFTCVSVHLCHIILVWCSLL